MTDIGKVTITATIGGYRAAGGLAAVRTRISEIQQKLGIEAVGGPQAANNTGNDLLAESGDFQQLLMQAQSLGGLSGSNGLSGRSGSGGDTSALMSALGTTPVYAAKPAGLPPVTVSATMKAAGNGNLPDSMLVPIGQGGHRLSAPAADAFSRLAAAARRDGVRFGVTSSYRSYAEQVATADEVGLYGQGGWAAVPGTSNHGWGLAVDLDLDARAQAWMRNNAWRYGFFEDVPDEPWHWTYRSAS